MMRLIEKLREQPEESRKAVALAVSLALTGVIFAAWIIGAARDFGGTIVLGDTLYQSAAAESGAANSPFSALSRRLGDLAETFRSGVASVTDEVGGLDAGGVEYERAE